ncbi:MAG TPA: RNA polymerase sigma factor [Anaerolineaceae bacterium]|nr:RNA polymerase sigma factor [Anaerolineaceae bacterium]
MGLQNYLQHVETSLIRSARQGDLAAFNRLAMDHQDSAYNLAYYIFGDEKTAETATTQGIVSAYQRIKSYPGSSFRSWVLRCVLAACQELSRAARTGPVSRSLAYPGGADFLASLPLEERVLVILVDIEGLSYTETAWIVGKGLDQVRSGLACARMHIGESAALVG